MVRNHTDVQDLVFHACDGGGAVPPHSMLIGVRSEC
jgi:hypothetical protein